MRQLMLGLMMVSALLWADEPSVIAGKELRQEVVLLTYHAKAPYIIDEQQERGFYYDVARYLTQHSSRYFFKTRFMPRTRLNAQLDHHQPVVVIGAQLVWFKSYDDQLIESLPFVDDLDMFVSLASKPFRDQDLARLNTRTFIGCFGYRYKQLDGAIASKVLRKVETLEEDKVLEMLRLQRGDFTVMSQASLLYHQQHSHDATEYYVAKTPHEEIHRHFLVPKHWNGLTEELNRIIATMPKDDQWLTLVNGYGLQPSALSH